jgi:hypothetical protein
MKETKRNAQQEFMLHDSGAAKKQSELDVK